MPHSRSGIACSKVRDSNGCFHEDAERSGKQEPRGKNEFGKKVVGIGDESGQ